MRLGMECVNEWPNSFTCHPHVYPQVQQSNRINYTSPALCTPIIPFPPIGDAAYRQRTGEGPSHGYRQHAQKNLILRPRMWFWRFPRGQTDTQTDILITILRNRSSGRSNEPYLPLLHSRRASPHFGPYLFSVPLRAGDGVGLGVKCLFLFSLP